MDACIFLLLTVGVLLLLLLPGTPATLTPAGMDSNQEPQAEMNPFSPKSRFVSVFYHSHRNETRTRVYPQIHKNLQNVNSTFLCPYDYQ